MDVDFPAESERCGCEIFCALTAALMIVDGHPNFFNASLKALRSVERTPPPRLISVAPSDHNDVVSSEPGMATLKIAWRDAMLADVRVWNIVESGDVDSFI